MWVFDGLSCKNKRSTNMDRLMIGVRDVEGQRVLLAVICDGVGSTTDGEKAASITVQMLADWFEAVDAISRLGLDLRNRILLINQNIAQTLNGNERRAATTVSALLLIDNYYYLVHVGDCRVFLGYTGEIKQLTIDQAENGKLLQYIGQSDHLIPQYDEGPMPEGVILLCTDGVFKRISPDEIAESVKGIKQKTIRKTMESIINQAIQRGEADNITLAIVMKER